MAPAVSCPVAMRVRAVWNARNRSAVYTRKTWISSGCGSHAMLAITTVLVLGVMLIVLRIIPMMLFFYAIDADERKMTDRPTNSPRIIQFPL